MALLEFQIPEKVVMEKDRDFYGKFQFRPLERGYGITVGNALRRVLLSSLEGYAFTSIKIPGVDHEFSVVPGVIEDVTELILNLKGVRLKKINDGDNKIFVSIRGKEVFTAGDIADHTAAFQITNPKHVVNQQYADVLSGLAGQGGIDSFMPNLTEDMSARQLMDLVAFLNSVYRTMEGYQK